VFNFVELGALPANFDLQQSLAANKSKISIELATYQIADLVDTLVP
jgi:hypothetical protein